jgi:hypothetical protein
MYVENYNDLAWNQDVGDVEVKNYGGVGSFNELDAELGWGTYCVTALRKSGRL